MTPEQLERLVQELVAKLMARHEPGRNRVIVPENVYQPANAAGRDEFEAFQLKLLLPGSGVVGLEHLEHCLGELREGRSVIFLPEHRGNLDVTAFNALLRREDPRYHEILDRLIYIAGRKLNESSELIKMFTERYSRLVIVPRRELPPPPPGETAEQALEREENERQARRINRAAFREMLRLKRQGYIFVLFPLGGRWKPDEDNIPVKETTSYLDSFDTAYPISMEGNTLPPLPRMEDERPRLDRVEFRIGAPLECRAFLAAQRERYDRAAARGELPAGLDFEQFAVNRIMAMLDELRTTGRYVP